MIALNIQVFKLLIYVYENININKYMFMKTQTEITNSFYFCSTDIRKLSLETESYTNVFTYKGVVHTLILV